MKLCGSCGQEKAESCFRLVERITKALGPAGMRLDSWCRDCRVGYARAWRKVHGDPRSLARRAPAVLAVRLGMVGVHW